MTVLRQCTYLPFITILDQSPTWQLLRAVGPHLGSVPIWLCDLGQVTEPSFASISAPFSSDISKPGLHDN